MIETKKIDAETFRRLLEIQRTGNYAVRKAQAENRRLGIPNWYSINGKLVSDQAVTTSTETDHENHGEPA